MSEVVKVALDFRGKKEKELMDVDSSMVEVDDSIRGINGNRKRQ